MRASTGWKLPLEEVSALCLGDGGASLVGVGDDRWRFARAAIAPDGLSLDDPTPVDGRPAAEEDSEFEGIASDGSGRLFVLREGPAVVILLDSQGDIEHTIRLQVGSDFPRLGPEWNDPEKSNSRGEGLLLLRDGRILVAKQRESTWLIEFGPAGAEPRGFTGESPLAPGETFALDRGSPETVMDALAAWLVDQEDIKSLNDLAIGADGRLYLISSKSRRLLRLDHDLDARGGSARLVGHDLPDELFLTDDDKAESLVYATELGWIVGLDLDREGDNVFRLTGVPEGAS